MDDTTKKILQMLATGAVKKILITAGTAAAAHGFTSGIPSEAYPGMAIAIVAAGYSFWNDYGKAIVLSQLEVLKAKSLASAEKIRAANLAPVTVVDIAKQSPVLTPTDVAKIAATLPPAVQESVTGKTHLATN